MNHVSIKLITALCGLLLFTVFSGCKDSPQDAAEPLSSGKPLPVIELGPKTSRYLLADVYKGDMQFAVSVENQGDSDLTFAHPVICFPEDYRIGDSLNLQEYHGKSEIVLSVEKPDGSVVTLRDGPHFFDPDKNSYFVIKPGDADLFYIGWFFQNARGGWEDNLQAETIFTGRGDYKLKLLYRNFFPKALVHDGATGTSHFIDVWTGEVESNTITVTIE